MIGRNAKGGFHTSPTAAYPPGLCRFVALLIFMNWSRQKGVSTPCGGAEPSLPASATSARASPPGTVVFTEEVRASVVQTSPAGSAALPLAPAPSVVTTLASTASSRNLCPGEPGTEELGDDSIYGGRIITEADIARASLALDAQGIDIPLMDGLGEAHGSPRSSSNQVTSLPMRR